ncbi:MAG: hypothetical protein HYW90_02885 [Candidatus Sungbacteria bacterium]|nr:hypothetical protein [Candidatus Sungbacteria bacterium]
MSLKVYIVVFSDGIGQKACEIAARDEAEAIKLVREDPYSAGAKDIHVLGELKNPVMLRWLPYIPSKSWVERRNG